MSIPITVQAQLSTNTVTIPCSFDPKVEVQGNVEVLPLSVTENGEYSEQGKTYSPVTVNVPGIIPTGTLQITGNGTHDVTQYASANVQRPFMGDNPTLIRSFLADKVYLKDTGYATWTPSTSASVIVPSADVFTFDADMLHKDYVLCIQYYVRLFYNEGAQQRGMFLEGSSEAWTAMYRYPSGINQLLDRNNNANGANPMVQTVNTTHYYSANGGETSVYSLAYGITCAVQMPTVSNTTTNNPTYTVKSPSINARCHDSYLTTYNAAYVDKNTSYYQLKYILYSVDYGTCPFRIAQDSKNELIITHGQSML